MSLGLRNTILVRFMLVAAIATVSLCAQTAGTGTLVGTVTDTTGAVVMGAKVRVVNVATSFVSEATTTGEGSYYVPYLAPGTYRLTVELEGFKRYVREGVVVRTGEIPRVDVLLELGAVTESVQVTGAPPLLATETSASGQVLDGDLLVQVPVSQKRAIRIMFYYPNTSQINGYHVLGQRSRSIGIQVDGVNAKEPALGNPGAPDAQLSPTQDAFQEVKVHTTGMPAEYGHGAGGLMTMTFKSGTNDFHGVLENRYINKELIHRNYLEQLRATNPFSYNERTALASGPVRIPKLYNGKDRTFWLFGLARHAEVAGTQSARATVPTADMMRGDFSFGGQTSPRVLPIYNPFTTRQVNGQWVRDPFPNNIIPQSLIDPAVQNFFSRNPWNAPNEPGIATATGPIENLIQSQPKEIYRTRVDAKIDHQFTPSHKIFGRWSQSIHRAWKGDHLAQFAWREIDPNAQPRPVDHMNFAFSDMLIVSPTISNEFRVGVNRRKVVETPFTANQNWAQQLGIPNVSGATFPHFNLGSGAFAYGLGQLPGFQDVAEDFTIQNNVTKIAGKHTFKAGYELMRTRYNSTVPEMPSGIYSFTGTNAPFTPNTGIPFASFLLGTVERATFTQQFASWLPRWWSHQWYIQDDWKPIRGLTLNLGVRYSYESPFQTKYGQQSQFDPTAIDPLTGRPGAILHQPGPLAKRDLNNFAPRIGLAWNFAPKFVFRSSFGIIHQDLFVSQKDILFQEYFATANIEPLPGDPRHAFRLSEGPPSFQYNVQPDGSVPFVGRNFGQRDAHTWDPNMRLPYIMNWSGGIQYEFKNDWLVELQYQGQSGVGLLNGWNMNQIPLNVSRDPVVLNQIFQRTQDFRPFPHFGNIIHYSNYGHNSHHAGTVRVERRMSRGLFFTTFYTWGKTITEAEGEAVAGGIDFYNRRLEKARANYDIRHRSVSLLSFDMPFGRGRRWMNKGGVANHLLGGWQLTWTQTFQSGPPFNVVFAGSPHRYLPGASRPHLVTNHQAAQVPNWELGPHRFPTFAQNPYLLADAFEYPDAFTPGTLGRNIWEAPGLNWTQFALAKWWNITERVRVQLRLDGNNMPFKQPQFGNPNGTFNRNNLGAFARIGNATRGSFSDVGTSRSHFLIVTRVEF
ncbi:MAG: carboxypeptidase regulatory-like domain-containing protein [Bryobacteraceae bacterium]